MNILYVIWLFSCSVGDILWVRTYDSGIDDYNRGMAVDNLGNIIVTGETGIERTNNWDYLTIKYNSDGDIVWVKKFDSGSKDYGGDVTTDKAGNIYVVGSSFNKAESLWGFLTIKYDSGGDTVWTKWFPHGLVGRAIVLDSEKNIIITGESDPTKGSYDYLTVKYTTNGDTIWSRRYDNDTYNDWSMGLSTDKERNIVVAGKSGPDKNWECLIIKYGSNGEIKWTKEYDSPFNEYAFGVVVDNRDNIIITGPSFDTTSSNFDCLIIKYDSNGNIIWSKKYDNGYDEWGTAITVDSLNNIFIAGVQRNGEKKDIIIILKYNSSGEFLWSKKYDSGHDDYAAGIALDALGNLIISGSSYNGRNWDYLTIKYKKEAMSIREKQESQIAEDIPFLQIEPNPCRETMRIRYYIMEEEKEFIPVKLTLYNACGQKVKTFIKEYKKPGMYSIKWNGTDEKGARVSPGFYFCEFVEGKHAITKKVLWLK